MMTNVLKTVAGMCLAVALALNVRAQPDAPPRGGGGATPGPSAAAEQMASCLLRVTYQDGETLLDSRVIEELLSSSVFLEQVAKDAGLPEDSDSSRIILRVEDVNRAQTRAGGAIIVEAALKVSLTLVSDGPLAPNKAQQGLKMTCKRLESTVATGSSERASWLRERADRTLEIAQRAEARAREAQETRQKARDEAGRADPSRGAIIEEAAALEHQQQETEVKLAGHRARQTALAEQIARLSAAATRAATDDPVVVELEKVVKIREQELQRVQELIKTGRAGSQEMEPVEEKVALARAELARRRQAASEGAGGSLLADLNRELLTLTVDIAEAEARREFVQTSLARLRDPNLLRLADQYVNAEEELNQAHQSVRDAHADRRSAAQELESYRPPAISVLGATER